jgi:hypothetical protein
MACDYLVEFIVGAQTHLIENIRTEDNLPLAYPRQAQGSKGSKNGFRLFHIAPIIGPVSEPRVTARTAGIAKYTGHHQIELKHPPRDLIFQALTMLQRDWLPELATAASGAL